MRRSGEVMRREIQRQVDAFRGGRSDDRREVERPRRRRLVLTNARVAVITGTSCAIAAAFATLAFLDLAEMQGQDRERAVQISVIVALFLAILWLSAVASLPRSRR